MAGAIGIDDGGLARIPKVPGELLRPLPSDPGNVPAILEGVAGLLGAGAERQRFQRAEKQRSQAEGDRTDRLERRRQADIDEIREEEDNRQIRAARGHFNAGVIARRTSIPEMEDEDLQDLAGIAGSYQELAQESLDMLQSDTAKQALADEFLQTVQVEAAKGVGIATKAIRLRQGLSLKERLDGNVKAARDADPDTIFGVMADNAIDIMATNLIPDAAKDTALLAQDRRVALEYLSSLRRNDPEMFIEEVNSGRLGEFLLSGDIDTLRGQAKSGAIGLIETERDFISEELKFRGEDYNNPDQHLADGLLLTQDFKQRVMQLGLDSSDSRVRRIMREFGIEPGGIDPVTGKETQARIVGIGEIEASLVRRHESVVYAQAVTAGERRASSAPAAVEALDDYFTGKVLPDILAIEDPVMQGLRMTEIRRRYQFVPTQMTALFANDSSIPGLIRYTTFLGVAQKEGIPSLLANTTKGVYGSVSQRVYDIADKALEYVNSKSARVEEAVVLAIQDIDTRVPDQRGLILQDQLSGVNARADLTVSLREVVTEIEGEPIDDGFFDNTDSGDMAGLPIPYLLGRYQINFRRTGDIKASMRMAYADMKRSGWKISVFRGVTSNARWMRFDPQEIDEYRDTNERGPRGYYHEEQMVDSLRQIYRRVGINLARVDAFDVDELSIAGFIDPRDNKPSYHVIWGGEIDVENGLFPGIPIGWPEGSGGGLEGTPISLRPDKNTNPRLVREFIRRQVELGEFGTLGKNILQENTFLIDITVGDANMAKNQYARIVFNEMNKATDAGTKDRLKQQAALILILQPTVKDGLGLTPLNTEIIKLAEELKRGKE